MTEKAPNSLPGIDLDEALERLVGDRELLITILSAMVNEYFEHHDGVHAKLVSGDQPWLANYFHKLKGIAGNLAAGQICDTAEAAETACAAGDFQNALELVGKLDEYFQNLKSALAI